MHNTQSSRSVKAPAMAAIERLSSYPFYLNNSVDTRRFKWVEASTPKHRRLCQEDTTTGATSPITFVAIGRLATGQYRFKLLPEGELAGGGKALSKDLAKVIATGELTQPDPLDKAGDTPLRDAWPRIMKNCEVITESARSKPSSSPDTVTCYSFNSNGNIKFKHPLFVPGNPPTTSAAGDNSTDSTVTESDSDDDTGTELAAAITAKHDGMAFHISNWPMPAAYKAAFDKLKADHHDVVPIPAYDLDGDPILPAHYRSQLEGALVELHFSIEAWNFPEKSDNSGNKTDAKDTVSAILTRVDVLDRKRPDLPTSPMRPRRPKRQGTPLCSPSKRHDGGEQKAKVD